MNHDELLARIKALESDAEVDAQLIRDKDAEIERLKEYSAQLFEENKRAAMAMRSAPPTRQPPSSECLIAGMTCPCPCHSRQPLREMTAPCAYCRNGVAGGHWCEVCSGDKLSPRGGEGESGGHKERP